MDINFPLLTPDQIEVKVKKINDGSVVLLLYKTARTDMDMLDKAVGPMNWETDYKEIKGNLYCGIGIRDDDGNWVWKWDCGTESRTDEEGNQKKGEASDAFKRAGFKWGIGRELYTGPSIVAFVPTEEYRGKPALKEKHHKYDGFTVGDIAYDCGRISCLRIDDSHGNAVYTYPKTSTQKPIEQKSAKPEQKPDPITAAKANPLNIPPKQTKPTNTGSAQLATAKQKEMLRNVINLDQLNACNKMYGANWERMTANQCATMYNKIMKGRAAS